VVDFAFQGWPPDQWVLWLFSLQTPVKCKSVREIGDKRDLAREPVDAGDQQYTSALAGFFQCRSDLTGSLFCALDLDELRQDLSSKPAWVTIDATIFGDSGDRSETSATAPFGHGSASRCKQITPIPSRDHREWLSALHLLRKWPSVPRSPATIIDCTAPYRLHKAWPFRGGLLGNAGSGMGEAEQVLKLSAVTLFRAGS